MSAGESRRKKVLLTAPIRSRADFFAEMGAFDDAPAPHNLDALAELLMHLDVTDIYAAQLELAAADLAAISKVLTDHGVRLWR